MARRPRSTPKKRKGPCELIGSREHGQKRGGGPQGTAPASPQQPEGRRYYAAGGLRRRLEPGVSREGQLSFPSIRYQLTAWASIGGGSEGEEERAFMPGSYRTGEQYTPDRALHGERGKMFPFYSPAPKAQGAPSATPVPIWVLVPLHHPVGIRKAGQGPRCSRGPFSPQREDLPRPPERRLRERFRPRTRLRSSPSSSSSAS